MMSPWLINPARARRRGGIALVRSGDGAAADAALVAFRTAGAAPRRDRAERAAGRLVAPPSPGKSGKGQDFTLSACRLALRQVPSSRRLRWIVRPESGRNGRQPIVPAEFFACGAPAATHLD